MLYSFGNLGPDLALIALRLGLGIIFLLHGIKKWAMWNMQPSGQMSAGMLNMMKILAVAEPLGALGVLTGVLLQPAAIGLAVIMLGAIYLKATQWGLKFIEDGKSGWEFDFILLAALLALVFFGNGGTYVISLEP